MSYLADAHSDWHAVNGANEICPLDCGVGEAQAEAEFYESMDSVDVYRDDIEAHVRLFEPPWYDEPFPDWQE